MPMTIVRITKAEAKLVRDFAHKENGTKWSGVQLNAEPHAVPTLMVPEGSPVTDEFLDRLEDGYGPPGMKLASKIRKALP